MREGCPHPSPLPDFLGLILRVGGLGISCPQSHCILGHCKVSSSGCPLEDTHPCSALSLGLQVAAACRRPRRRAGMSTDRHIIAPRKHLPS